MKSVGLYKDRYDVFLYNDPFELIEEGEQGERKHLHSRKVGSSFTMSRNWNHMKEIIREGENIPLLENAKEHIVQYTQQLDEALVYDTGGSYVDVGRFLDGEPECMVDFQDSQVSRKFCTVILNGAENASVDAGLMLKKAALTASLVETLEHHKVRCNLMLVYPVDGLSYERANNKDAIAAVTIKQHKDPLHLSAFNAMHPSYFRRAVFGFIETVCNLNPPVGYGRIERGWYDPEQEGEFKSLLGLREDEQVVLLDNFSNNRNLKKALINEDWKQVAEFISSYVKDIV